VGERVKNRQRKGRILRGTLLGLLLGSALTGPVTALDKFVFLTPGADDGLRKLLESSSLVAQAERDKITDPQDLFASARADYGRLIGALYAEGYYSGTISVRVDGREAAEIPPLDAPATIRSIEISVKPGPQFTFLKARMKPYARGTKLPGEYGDTGIARSTAIAKAAKAGVEGWRNIGHAKSRVTKENIIADHRAAQIDSEILLDPGPRLRFGELHITGYERMRVGRVARIAGFKSGEVFDPKALDTVAARLRRTGVFRSVTLTEAENIGPGDTLDIDLVVEEEALRRIGAGAEISNSDGLSVNGYWLHRNLLGGGERLRVDAAINGIQGTSGGTDYSLGARIERPATPTPDTTAFSEIRAKRLNEVDYSADIFTFGIGQTRILSKTLSGDIELAYESSVVTDSAGKTTYRLLSLPLTLRWDKRDEKLDPRNGYYAEGSITPFYGLGGTGSGGRLATDLRAYRGFGEKDRFVLAGRVQAGSIVGPSIVDTPRDFLFYTGGGGSVRGQPYQSLGVQVLSGGTVRSGGMSFASVSAELRAGITEKIGGVAFFDAGYVTEDGLFSGGSGAHSGAGIGIRYATAIGPIRFDVAAPVTGSTGSGVQFYLGIGQSF
jgi:translocation and assembly module TamA